MLVSDPCCGGAAVSAWARPGVKCVCVKNSVRTVNDLGLPPFVKGQVFTITKVEESPIYGTLLYFVERPRQWGHINGFRPLVTRTEQQDVALFHHLLTGKPVEVDA